MSTGSESSTGWASRKASWRRWHFHQPFREAKTAKQEHKGMEIHTRCVHAKSLQLCLTLCNAVDYSPCCSSVHGILEARILEWVAMPTSKGSSWPRDWTRVSSVCCTGRWVLYHSCHLGSPLHKVLTRKDTPGLQRAFCIPGVHLSYPWKNCQGWKKLRSPIFCPFCWVCFSWFSTLMLRKSLTTKG